MKCAPPWKLPVTCKSVTCATTWEDPYPRTLGNTWGKKGRMGTKTQFTFGISSKTHLDWRKVIKEKDPRKKLKVAYFWIPKMLSNRELQNPLAKCHIPLYTYQYISSWIYLQIERDLNLIRLYSVSTNICVNSRYDLQNMNSNLQPFLKSESQ